MPLRDKLAQIPQRGQQPFTGFLDIISWLPSLGSAGWLWVTEQHAVNQVLSSVHSKCWRWHCTQGPDASPRSCRCLCIVDSPSLPHTVQAADRAMLEPRAGVLAGTRLVFIPAVSLSRQGQPKTLRKLKYPLWEHLHCRKLKNQRLRAVIVSLERSTFDLCTAKHFGVLQPLSLLLSLLKHLPGDLLPHAFYSPLFLPTLKTL